MVTHYNLDITQKVAFTTLISSEEFQNTLRNASSILVQYYSAQTDQEHLISNIETIKQSLPTAHIIAATTVGEIINGRSETGSNILGITLFEKTTINVIHTSLTSGEEYKDGEQLGRAIKEHSPQCKGVLLLSTPLSTDAASLLKGIESTRPNYQLFGGGAGDYASMNNSIVSYNEHLYSKGAVAVVLSGEELEISSSTYLGWRALSRPLKVTKVNGLVVETIDDKPAFDVYSQYLDIRKDENLFLNALEFPFMLERHGRLLARVPVDVSEDGGLIFVADIEHGETLRLGYGDPSLIIQGAESTQQSIHNCAPQAIFLYSCGCRRFLMQEDVELETLPFQKIAPTFGFYTYGEFFSDQGKMPLLNSTMVAVSIKEGESKAVSSFNTENHLSNDIEDDPYAHKHARIVSRLVHFINATTQELEQANQAKSQFLANTSHELRTPLTAISGYSEALIKGDIPDDEQSAAIKIIHNQSQHLLSLVNDILDISKIEAQKLDLTFSAFSLSELLQEITDTFRHQATQKQLSFDLNTQTNVPEFVFSEKERLNQILLNLCGNALKFTHTGHIAVNVSYSEIPQLLRIDVVDSGIGLNNQQLNNIFKPFSQITDSKNQTRPQGTGLGLSISQNLAKQLGGEITVSSEVEQGSTFSLTLPVQVVDAIDIAPEPELTNDAGRYLGRILLAEDTKENAELFKLFLVSAGFEVVVVENGDMAVQIALADPFDLILLDIQMPVLNGIQAMEFLRFSGINCPIIALTANAMASDVQNYLQLGFNDCIAKPIKKESFVRTIMQYSKLSTDAHLKTLPTDTIEQLKMSAVKSLQIETNKLTQLLSAADYAEISATAHKIKGIAAQFEFQPLAKLGYELELESEPEKLSQLIDKIVKTSYEL